MLLASATAAPADPWQGLYGGAQGGYGEADFSGGLSEIATGASGGFHLGYDLNLGGYILGGEIDHDVIEIEFGGGSEEIEGVTRFKLRAGANRGDTLAYGTAGLARAATTIGNDGGYFLGAGLGHDVGDGWILGGEVLFQSFEDIAGSGISFESSVLNLRASLRF